MYPERVPDRGLPHNRFRGSYSIPYSSRKARYSSRNVAVLGRKHDVAAKTYSVDTMSHSGTLSGCIPWGRRFPGVRVQRARRICLGLAPPATVWDTFGVEPSPSADRVGVRGLHLKSRVHTE